MLIPVYAYELLAPTGDLHIHDQVHSPAELAHGTTSADTKAPSATAEQFSMQPGWNFIRDGGSGSWQIFPSHCSALAERRSLQEL